VESLGSQVTIIWKYAQNNRYGWKEKGEALEKI